MGWADGGFDQLAEHDLWRLSRLLRSCFVKGRRCDKQVKLLGGTPYTVTVTTMGYRSYKNPLNKAPLRTVTGRGNDPGDGFGRGFVGRQLSSFLADVVPR